MKGPPGIDDLAGTYAVVHSSLLLPTLALLFSAAAWGTAWLPLRMLDARGVHPLWTTACVYAVLVMVTGLFWRPHLKSLVRNRRWWVQVLASGVASSA